MTAGEVGLQRIAKTEARQPKEKVMPASRLVDEPPVAATGVRRGAEGWYIVTNFFRLGGKVYADLGPFESEELALTVRTYVEASPGVKARGQTFAVDHWPGR